MSVTAAAGRAARRAAAKPAAASRANRVRVIECTDVPRALPPGNNAISGAWDARAESEPGDVLDLVAHQIAHPLGAVAQEAQQAGVDEIGEQDRVARVD